MADIEKDLNELNNDIKECNYPKLYFFYGKENYLKKFYIDKIINSLLDETNKDMNLDIINKEDYTLERVRQGINTLPFFAEKRVLILQDIGILTKTELGDILENIPDNVLVIVSEMSGKKKKEDKEDKEEKNEGAKKKVDILKIIKKVGKLIELEKISDSIAVKKVISVAKQNGKEFLKSDAEYMIARVGIDLSLIMNELDKLIAYVDTRSNITKKDIDNICVQSLESKVFDLIKHICNKNMDGAIKQYHNMITNKEPAVLMLFMIARQYTIMYEALLLDAKGYNINQIAEMTDANQTFVAKECLMQGKKYGIKKVESILKECLKTDIKLKNGEDTLELLIYKIILEY